MTRERCPVNDFRIKISKLISIRDMKVIFGPSSKTSQKNYLEENEWNESMKNLNYMYIFTK